MSRLNAIDKNSKDHHLPVALASIFASKRFLFPFYIWNSPVYPIYRKPEVLSYCYSTIFDMLLINS